MEVKKINMKTTALLSILLLYALFTVSGCGMATAVSELRPIASKVKRANKTADEIEIYKQGNTPQKGVVFIANIGAHGNGYASMDTLENAMKKEAAKIGAELIILTEYQVSKDETIGSYGSGLFMSEQIQRPHLYGLGAVYSKVRLGAVFEDNGEIKYVTANTPADKAGLKEGMKILAINGVYFSNVTVWEQEGGIKNPGDVITIEYLDDTKEKRKATITLEPN